MTEFWESSFREKQAMWGDSPADSAIAAAELFKQHGATKILIPGFGYGRNAQPFIKNGCEVTGIEISGTAIELAKKYLPNAVKIHHGSVCDMPFDIELYDGIFCYALIHLLEAEDRIHLIENCYNQLKPGGTMFFIAISTSDNRYGQGEKTGKNTFISRHGISLFFYDDEAIRTEFGIYGLVDASEINEPQNASENKPTQKFWQIRCTK